MGDLVIQGLRYTAAGPIYTAGRIQRGSLYIRESASRTGFGESGYLWSIAAPGLALELGHAVLAVLEVLRFVAPVLCVQLRCPSSVATPASAWHCSVSGSALGFRVGLHLLLPAIPKTFVSRRRHSGDVCRNVWDKEPFYEVWVRCFHAPAV